MLNEYRYYIPSNNHNIKFGLRNKELDSETFIRCIYLQFSGDSALKRVLFCYKKKSIFVHYLRSKYRRDTA